MIRIDEPSLICDLAETYHIFDYKQLPLTTVAAFSCGLREDSRIKMIISKQKVSPNTLLLAGIEDKLSMLLWSKTKDGQKGLNPPKLLVEKLMGIETAQKQIAFKSGEEFEQARNKLLGKEVK